MNMKERTPPTTKPQTRGKLDKKKRMGEVRQTPKSKKKRKTSKTTELRGRKENADYHGEWTQNTQHRKLGPRLNERERNETRNNQQPDKK